MQTGVEGFHCGLQELGYDSAVVNGRPDHVVVTYTVQSGKFAGSTHRVGFIVPDSWPLNPPSGIHVGTLIHPFQSGGTHPTGGVHREHAEGFRSGLGGDWQYWSRPVSDWNTAKKTVSTFMSHVWRLWDSQ